VRRLYNTKYLNRKKTRRFRRTVNGGIRQTTAVKNHCSRPAIRSPEFRKRAEMTSAEECIVYVGAITFMRTIGTRISIFFDNVKFFYVYWNRTRTRKGVNELSAEWKKRFRFKTRVDSTNRGDRSYNVYIGRVKCRPKNDDRFLNTVFNFFALRSEILERLCARREVWMTNIVRSWLFSRQSSTYSRASGTAWKRACRALMGETQTHYTRKTKTCSHLCPVKTRQRDENTTYAREIEERETKRFFNTLEK